MKKHISRRAAFGKLHRFTRSRGFTLLETLVVIAITGILFAIAAASWGAFLNMHRLNTAQEQVFLAMRTAQTSAKHQHLPWQVDFREANQVLQWVIHPEGTTPPDSHWNSFDPNVQLDSETTLRKTRGILRVEFNHVGRVNGSTGRITLSGKGGGRAKRCVYVSTLLGTLRKASDRPTPKRDGSYCY